MEKLRVSIKDIKDAKTRMKQTVVQGIGIKECVREW